MDSLPVILLVEDEPAIRSALADTLEDGGFALLEAGHGDAAIQEVDKSEALCGLITDIRLGKGADGWAVARHARHRFPKIAVIYMTGDSAADWAAEGVPSSVLLQKPFAMSQVVTAFATLLNVADVASIPAKAAED